ncbi:MAG: hypothetical protein KF901_06440 [Myxococcales bacterium]|nr:hypothetical protein [Myxococcales bacterium]
MRLFTFCVCFAFLGACGDDDDTPRMDGGADALVNGCPSHEDPIAMPGDDVDGDTYETFAAPFLERFCTRCHSSTLEGDFARGGAPEGLDWDLEAEVRENAEYLRYVIGVSNEMPPIGTRPSCDERRRFVRWVDVGAP